MTESASDRTPFEGSVTGVQCAWRAVVDEGKFQSWRATCRASCPILESWALDAERVRARDGADDGLDSQGGCIECAAGRVTVGAAV